MLLVPPLSVWTARLVFVASQYSRVAAFRSHGWGWNKQGYNWYLYWSGVQFRKDQLMHNTPGVSRGCSTKTIVIHWLTHWFNSTFSLKSSKHLHSWTVRAKDLKFGKKISHSFTCHISNVTCHMSRLTCHWHIYILYIYKFLNTFVFFRQSSGASWWRVWYQWAYPF